MIFYDCPTAPSPRRARMFIAEKGLNIETHQVDLGKGEQLSPEFLAVNPLATVPVLVTRPGPLDGSVTPLRRPPGVDDPQPPISSITCSTRLPCRVSSRPFWRSSSATSAFSSAAA